MILNIFISFIILLLLLVYTNYYFEAFYSNKFELNNEAKNLIKNFKDEQQLREILEEKEEMKNKVKKIVKHAENVLDFTENEKDSYEKIFLQLSGNK